MLPGRPARIRERPRPLEQALEQGDEAAAVFNDRQPQLLPQRMVRQDAEIAADVGKNRADRPAGHFGGALTTAKQAIMSMDRSACSTHIATLAQAI